jgi:hypothetical protein
MITDDKNPVFLRALDSGLDHRKKSGGPKVEML